MRRALIMTLVLTIASALPAHGEDPWEPGLAGWTSGPVEHLATIPLEAGTAVGGVVHEGHLYVSTWRSFSIYDVADPERPTLRSVTPLAAQLINEGPTTNGEILLLADDSIDRRVQVWDVGDKAAPVLLAEVPHTNPDHIWACVLDCTWAYGSGGTILDLRDPAAPVIAGSWRTIAPFRVRHGIAEVAPGVVFVGSLPQYVLDARQDPADPTVAVTVEPPTTMFTGALGSGESLVSYQIWPRGRFALSTLETPFSGACNESSGSLVSFDTDGWEETGTFAVADVHRVTENGLPSDGLAPASAVGCSALALDAHPGFRKTRAVAVGWAEHGVRLFTVDKTDGSLSLIGGFLGHGTEAFAPVWGSDDVLYVIDTARGLDVLRVRLPSPPNGKP